MSSVDRRDAILEIFRVALGVEVTSTDTDIVETGLLDSLALVTLLVEIEQRFGVQIPFETLELDDLRSVDAIAGVLARLSERAS